MEKGNWKIDLAAHARLSTAPARKCAAALEAGKWKREIGKSISPRTLGCPPRQRECAAALEAGKWKTEIGKWPRSSVTPEESARQIPSFYFPFSIFPIRKIRREAGHFGRPRFPGCVLEVFD
jgi:hypothetical protein